MAVTGMLAVLAGTCAGAGLLLVTTGLVGTLPSKGRERPPDRWRQALYSVGRDRGRRRLIAAVAAGMGVLAVLGWPVAAVACAAGAYMLPPMLSAHPAAASIARLEALEQWARRLGEVMGASRGLEQTLVDSVGVAPAPIYTPVAALAARLDNRANPEAALRAFADQLDDPVGDLIAAELILAARRRGPGTRGALAALADAVAAEVRVRREVEAERASLRTTLLVIVIAVTALSAVFIASPAMSAPYGTPLGQMVLAGVAGMYAAGLAWMRRLATITTGTRFLHQPNQRGTGIGARS